MSDVYRVTLDFGDFDAESEDEAREAAAETFVEQPYDMAMMMKVSNASDQGQAYVFTESATRQDVTDVDGMVDGGRMALISVIRLENNDAR